MEIIRMNISEVKQYHNNSKKHPKNQIEKLKNSILEFGFNNPILVDETGVIMAGHGRYQAALELELQEVPVIVISGLTEAQKKAYRIADNRISDDGSYDYIKLSMEFKEFEKELDLELAGFDLNEIEGIMDIQGFAISQVADIDEGYPQDNENNDPVDSDVKIYKPVLEPTFSSKEVSEEEVDKKEKEIKTRFNSTIQQKETCVCPNCGEEFEIG